MFFSWGSHFKKQATKRDPEIHPENKTLNGMVYFPRGSMSLPDRKIVQARGKRLPLKMLLRKVLPVSKGLLKRRNSGRGFVQQIFEGLPDKGKLKGISQRQQFIGQDLLSFQKHIAEFPHDQLEHEAGDGG